MEEAAVIEHVEMLSEADLSLQVLLTSSITLN